MSFIVDDSDPLVQYSSPGGWTATGDVPEFEGTSHASATPGDTATLAFEGTSISVYGTIADGEAGLNFSIDGVVVGSYQSPEVDHVVHNLLFWTSPPLTEASHQLVVTVDQDSSTDASNRSIFLDYFIYNTTSTAGKTVLFDDSDAILSYSPDWQVNTDSDSSLRGTEHVSTSARASVALSFQGTQISFFGPSGQKGLQASVVIDGSDSHSGVITQSNTQNQLFASSVLPPGQHTINVTVLTGDPTAIDYFFVENTATTLPSPTNTPASDGTQKPVSSSLASSHASKALPITAIVGGAVGALVILVLILVGLLMRRRRAHIRSNRYISQFVMPAGPQQAGSDAAIVSRRQTLQHEARTSLVVGQSVTSESVHSTLPSYHEETTEVPPPYFFKR
ncbi:hypothetical protein K438DRAFT_1893841 [Mycena galopus ATCC 62051]|nr:hypothetical protein K438DRAFT_1893841 [Mycena galopus ATCC 62051]